MKNTNKFLRTGLALAITLFAFVNMNASQSRTKQDKETTSVEQLKEEIRSLKHQLISDLSSIYGMINTLQSKVGLQQDVIFGEFSHKKDDALRFKYSRK